MWFFKKEIQILRTVHLTLRTKSGTKSVKCTAKRILKNYILLGKHFRPSDIEIYLLKLLKNVLFPSSPNV
jgi:hypothetical protein